MVLRSSVKFWRSEQVTYANVLYASLLSDNDGWLPYNRHFYRDPVWWGSEYILLAILPSLQQPESDHIVRSYLGIRSSGALLGPTVSQGTGNSVRDRSRYCRVLNTRPVRNSWLGRFHLYRYLLFRSSHKFHRRNHWRVHEPKSRSIAVPAESAKLAAEGTRYVDDLEDTLVSRTAGKSRTQ
jgi:hypothetical protein